MTKQSFTLIELLIVVAIIAIIAAIAVPNLLEAQTRSKVSRSQNDGRTIALALEIYAIDYRYYPPQDPDLIDPYSTTVPYYKRLRPLTTPTAYLTSLPHDPFNKSGDPHDGTRPATYDYAVEDHWCSPRENWRNLQGTAWYWRAKYMITGWGPIGKWGVPEGWWHIPYDPTNGTVSLGNILRLGPGNITPSLN